jgi:hypothetical protein
MNTNRILAAAVLALAMGVTACAKGEPEQYPAAPAQDQTGQQGMDHSQMKDECDMTGMDMSKMSAEEHQAMMEKCPQGGTKTDGHADHDPDGQGGR